MRAVRGWEVCMLNAGQPAPLFELPDADFELFERLAGGEGQDADVGYLPDQAAVQ